MQVTFSRIKREKVYPLNMKILVDVISNLGPFTFSYGVIVEYVYDRPNETADKEITNKKLWGWLFFAFSLQILTTKSTFIWRER